MPTIERVEVRAVAPDVSRYRYSELLPEVFKTTTIVRVIDKGGYEGLGAYDSDSHGGFDLAALETLRTLVPQLVGRDPLERESLWHELRDLSTSPFAPAVSSAIDIALWDLVSRHAEMPLYRLLGGARDRMLAYASTPVLPDCQAYVAYVDELRAQGYRAIKFHAWCDPDRDLDMLRAVQDAHRNADLIVMHDAEQLYDRRSALRVARELEEMGLRWFEAPLPDYDLDGYRELRRRTRVPILPAGNAIWEIHHLTEALRDRPWDAIRFDVTFSGGITPGRKLFALAEAFGMDVELLSYGHTLVQAANLHLALAFRNSNFFEQAVPYQDFEFGAANPIRVGPDGFVEAPQQPGLGILLDWERIAQATVASFACP